MTLRDRAKAFLTKWPVQLLIAVSFSVLTIVSMIFLGATLSNIYTTRSKMAATESAEQLLNQTDLNLENYLRNMRLVSDTMYYSVIKDSDLSSDNIEKEMNLLYEANKDNLISIACYDNKGKLIASAPLSIEKENAGVQNQAWFVNAINEMENFHFSIPHVQNLFDNSSYRYYWVVSLSRAVELTNRGRSSLGVLVIDMNYSSIEKMFDKINSETSEGYLYLMDGQGNIIYHPKRSLIYAKLYEENNLVAADYSDGTVEETFNGEARLVTVKTVSYTGWKIVDVTKINASGMGIFQSNYYVVLIISMIMLILVILNQIISKILTSPLEHLANSIQKLDIYAENASEQIYVGGSFEVSYLGDTLRKMVLQIQELMEDIVVEQEGKRKSELAALQSQINPHFLYNTLDSIIWMIEGEQYKDAIFMIRQLASLFRISLSRGKNVITVGDEITHAVNYMNIQKVRYKNKFEVEFDIEEEIKPCATVKLVVQPILENAIYYAVGNMDDEGEVLVHGYRSKEDGDIYIDICDNGMGMSEDVVDNILKENNHVPKKGSGVGLMNVHQRINLYFGEPYGLIIRSELDRGTRITLHLPYQLYEQEGKKDEK